MDLYNELKRIAEKTEDERDRVVLLAAAMQLAPGPEPIFEKFDRLPQHNIAHYVRYYG